MSGFRWRETHERGSSNSKKNLANYRILRINSRTRTYVLIPNLALTRPSESNSKIFAIESGEGERESIIPSVTYKNRPLMT